MYVTLLLIAPVVCEWVEISQQHYRKPVRAHHFLTLEKVNEDEEQTTKFQQNFRKPPRNHAEMDEVTDKPQETTSYGQQTIDRVNEDPGNTANFHRHVRKPSRNNADMHKVTESYEESTSYKKQAFKVYEDQTPNFHRFRKPFRTHPEMGKVTESYEDTTSYRKPIRTQYLPTEIVTEVSIEDSLSDTPLYHYRKPIRPERLTDTVTENYKEETTSHYKPQTDFPGVKGDAEEYRTSNRIYLNRSVPETNVWTKGNVNKVSKYGNVQRVHLDNNAVKAPNLKTNSTIHSINKENSKDINKNKKDVEFLSEVAVKDVRGELTTTEISHANTFPKNVNIERRKSNYKDNKHKNEDRFDIDNADFKTTTDWNFKLATNRPKNNITLGIPGNYVLRQNSPNSLFITKGETINFSDTTDKFDKRTSGPKISLEKPIGDTRKYKIPQHIEDETNGKRYEVPKRLNKNNENKLVTSNSKTKIEEPSEADFATVNDGEEVSDMKHSDKILNIEEDQAGNEPSISKANSMDNFMTLMKVVAETIRKNTKRTVNSKTTYLTNLKDTILRNIKERIDSTWPDDPPEGRRARQARAAQASARGHLEIPSSESALMTISFLTFAVFLIKLVLQVIQKYKNKTMMMTPAIIATVGRAAGAAAKQRSAAP